MNSAKVRYPAVNTLRYHRRRGRRRLNVVSRTVRHRKDLDMAHRNENTERHERGAKNEAFFLKAMISEPRVKLTEKSHSLHSKSVSWSAFIGPDFSAHFYPPLIPRMPVSIRWRLVSEQENPKMEPYAFHRLHPSIREKFLSDHIFFDGTLQRKYHRVAECNLSPCYPHIPHLDVPDTFLLNGRLRTLFLSSDVLPVPRGKEGAGEGTNRACVGDGDALLFPLFRVSKSC